MTWLRLIGGIVLVLLGLLWIGQGLNLLAGSAMSGQAMWAIIGVLVALVGACLLGAPRAGAAPLPFAREANAQRSDRPGQPSDTLATSR